MFYKKRKKKKYQFEVEVGVFGLSGDLMVSIATNTYILYTCTYLHGYTHTSGVL